MTSAQTRTRFARFVLRGYPWHRGKWRIASTLIAGSPAGRSALPDERLLRGFPDGDVVRTQDGLRIRVYRDPMYVEPYLFGSYEPTTTQMFSQLLRAGDLALDVGANFGWFTTLFSALVGPKGRVHAFEPVPWIAELARETLALNGSPETARLHELGVGDAEGDLTVYTFDHLPHGHASASDLGRTDATPHVCPVTTLDRFAEGSDLGEVKLLKVDVEGFEREVFLGATGLLGSENAPIVAFELNPACLSARGIVAGDVLRPLLDAGYDTFWEISEERGPIELGDPPPERSANCLAATSPRASEITRAVRSVT